MHGCDPRVSNWSELFWGTPPYKPGRLPKALNVAFMEGAGHLIINTADALWDRQGGETVLHRVRTDIARVFEFSCFGGFDQAAVLDHFNRTVTLDPDAHNTVEEIIRAARRIGEHAIQRLTLVSSPTHLPRCLRDACTILPEHGVDLSAVELFATPTQTSYAGADSRGVAIIEPPHRADHDGLPLHQLAARMLKVPSIGRTAFAMDLADLLERHGV
jgi:hypothetical protein